MVAENYPSEWLIRKKKKKKKKRKQKKENQIFKQMNKQEVK